MNLVLRVNAPAVVGEVIDGEAVIMDLATGHYYSAEGVGASIWSAIDAGVSRATLSGWLGERYPAESGALAGALDAFVAELCAHALVIEVPGDEASLDAPPLALPAGRFVAPVLNSYTDMEELLQLDPVHDVDEAGWPVARAPDPPAA